MKRKNSIRHYLLIGVIAIIIYSCKKEDEKRTTTPDLTTTEVSSIRHTSANSGGYITSDGGTDITVRGVCWSINANPTIDNNKTSDGSGVQGFTSNISGLSANTLYHIRAYATNNFGTAYGNDLSFTTRSYPIINSETVKDIDGNIYHTVTIGSQVWMVENLKVIHFRNGDPIPKINENAQWHYSSNNNIAYCDYMNDPANSSIYGRLYKSYTAEDPRILAPVGWHVPSDAEWKTLTDYLKNNDYGYPENYSFIAKSIASKSGWEFSDKPGTVGNDQASNNTSSFTAFPAGSRDFEGSFQAIGITSTWWSSDHNQWGTSYQSLLYDTGFLYGAAAGKDYGLSVRCVKN